MTPRPPRRDDPADLRAFDRVCERLGGFDAALDFEFVDGFLCALAAGPHVPPVDDWLPLLFDDTFDRVFADPDDRAQAMRALQQRLKVLADQLDAEALIAAPDRLRLEPLVAAPVAAGADGADAALPPPGARWADGFVHAVAAWPALWHVAADDPDRASFDALLATVDALRGRPLPVAGAASGDAAGEPATVPAGVAPPTRDDAIDAACWAVQDLRVLFVDRAPVTAPRRVDKTPGRNDPCPCGSGRKYKKCCGA